MQDVFIRFSCFPFSTPLHIVRTLMLSSKAFIVFFYSSFIGKTCQWPIPSRQSQGVFQRQPSLPDSGDESWCTYRIYFIYISPWRRAKAFYGDSGLIPSVCVFLRHRRGIKVYLEANLSLRFFCYLTFCFVNSQNMKKTWTERRKRS